MATETDTKRFCSIPCSSGVVASYLQSGFSLTHIVVYSTKAEMSLQQFLNDIPFHFITS